MKGVASYLTSRSVEEAWEGVQVIFREVRTIRGCAKRLNVHERSLHRWLTKHGLVGELMKIRNDLLKQEIGKNG